MHYYSLHNQLCLFVKINNPRLEIVNKYYLYYLAYNRYDIFSKYVPFFVIFVDIWHNFLVFVLSIISYVTVFV